jgi:hypothetical protein
VVAVVTLEQVRQGAAARLYPRHVLVGCDDALVLFAAAFYGQQDAVWMADAGITTTCVDTDTVRLEEMRGVYPDGWEFVTADAFEFAVGTDRQWDVVSIDCPSNLFDRCAELLPLWARIARKVVVLGSGENTAAQEPDGWEFIDCVRRSHNYGGTYWRVFGRVRQLDPLAEDWVS